MNREGLISDCCVALMRLETATDTELLDRDAPIWVEARRLMWALRQDPNHTPALRLSWAWTEPQA